MRTPLVSLIGLGTLALSAAAFAADTPAPAAPSASAPMMHRGPLQQALDACAGKAEGTAVTWTGPRGQARTGTCKTHHGVMAARGARHHHHPKTPSGAASAPR